MTISVAKFVAAPAANPAATAVSGTAAQADSILAGDFANLLLGQLAVDLRWQKKGIARSLMFYALTTAVRLSDQVGCFCVLTHPLDDDVRALYAAFGFEDLPFDPARSMAVRIADLVRSGFGAAD